MNFEESRAVAKAKLAGLIRHRVPDHDASPEQRLRNRIEAAKARALDPEANEKENLQELRRQHYERTRSDGG